MLKYNGYYYMYEYNYTREFFRSKKFAALIDYIKKTNSKIVLPQIVKEEVILGYEKSVTEHLDKAAKEIERF